MPSLLAGVDKVIDPIDQSSQDVLSEESTIARFRAYGEGVVELVGEQPPDLSSVSLHRIRVDGALSNAGVDLPQGFPPKPNTCSNLTNISMLATSALASGESSTLTGPVVMGRQCSVFPGVPLMCVLTSLRPTTI
jgi:hypothetical protein